MESYISITQLNDFCFCPRSIYFHNIYQENYCEDVVHKVWQKEGQAAHKSIDQGTYSSRKSILQGMAVYSVKYGLMGKIDLFDLDTGKLTERKNSVTAVYPGFRYQIYAQYFALCEMGYHPVSLELYSKKSNQHYPIPLPGHDEITAFETLIDQIKTFRLKAPFQQHPNKCKNCIYNPICDFNPEADELEPTC